MIKKFHPLLFSIAMMFIIHGAYAVTDGDIFLGIRDRTSDRAYVVDIGSIDSFLSCTSSISTFDFTSGDLFSDLNQVVGNNWYANTNVMFTLIGGWLDPSQSSLKGFPTPYGGFLVGSPTNIALGAGSTADVSQLKNAVSNIGAGYWQSDPGSSIQTQSWISLNSADTAWSQFQQKGGANVNNQFGLLAYLVYPYNLETRVSNALSVNSVFATGANNGFSSSVIGNLTLSSTGTLLYTALSGSTDTPAYAGPWNWTNGSGNWGTSNNWTSNQVASNGYAVGISGTGGGTITNNAVTNISSLTFSNGAGSFTLTGTNASQIFTISGGITNNSAATQTISLGLNTTSNQAINAASGNLVFGGISNTAALSLQESVGKTISVNGAITGSGSLIQSGAGTLSLNGANSYSGGTTLNGGTVVAGNSNAFGSGGISIASNAAIAVGTSIAMTNAIGVSNGVTAALDNRGNAWLQNGAINGSGAISLFGSGTTTFSVSNNYAGGTTINGGGVVVGNNNSFGSGPISVASNSSITAGSANLSTTNAISIASGQIVSLNTAGNSWIQSGAMNGSGGVIITNTTGAGVLTLSASNTYTGSTFIAGSTVQVTGSLSSSGTITVAAGGTLSGTGSVGKTTVQSGGIITSGASGNIGTLSLSSLILNGGGSWTWKMLDATGVAGVGFDTLNLGTGTLDLSSLSSASKFSINLQSLSSTNPAVSGNASHFDQNVSTNWLIASYGGLAGTFTNNLFSIDATGFKNGLNGNFGIATNSSGLILTYTTAFVAGVAGEWNSASGSLSSKPLIVDGVLLTFSGTGGSVTNNSVSSLGGISFATNAGSYTFSGNAITNGGSGIVNNSTNAQVISNAITLGSVQSFTAGGSSLTLSGNLGISSNTLTVSGSNNTTLSGVVSGNAGIVKTGTGTLILSGADTFTGGVTISAGSLLLSGGDNRLWTNSTASVAAGSSLNLGTNSQQLSSLTGSGTVTGQSTATLTLAPSNASSFAGTITGGEAVAVAGSGTMILSGSNSYTGGTTVSGNLVASNASALGSPTNSLAVSGSLNLGSQTITQGRVSLDGGTIAGGTLSVTNVRLQGGTISANLGGAAIVTQSSGTTLLSGSNNFSGGVTVDGGTLVASNAYALAGGSLAVNGGTLNLTSISQSVGNVTLGNGTITGTGVMTSTSFTTTNSRSAFVSESLAGAGAFTQNGSGTTTLTGSNAYTGGTTVNSGTLIASNAFALGSTNGSLNVAGGTLDLGRFSQRVGSATLTSGSIGNGTLTAASGVTISGISNSTISAVLAGNGGLTKSGSGTLNLASAVPTGALRIAGGTLVSDSSVIGSLSNTTTTIAISNGASWQNSGLLTLGGVSNATATLSLAAGGTLVATNGLTIARDGGSKGTVTLGDANGSANLSLGSSTISFGAGNGTLQFAQNNAATLSNAISGKGTISSTGLGTTTLSGNQSAFMGTNYLSSGKVVLGSGVTNGGMLNIAGRGTNVVFAMNSNSVLSSIGTHAVAGLLLDNSGLAFTNAIKGQVVLAPTGVLQKTYVASNVGNIATNVSVAGFGAGIGAGKSFSILSGTTTATGANATTLQAKIVNGQLDFHGTTTNAFVMSMKDPSYSTIRNQIQWYNTNVPTGTTPYWTNTTAGNTGNVTNSAISGMNGKSFAGSFDKFLLAVNAPVNLGLTDANSNGSLLDDLNGLSGSLINSTLAKIMGAFGYDNTTKTSWAVINHNSIFGDGSATFTSADLLNQYAGADLSVFDQAPMEVQAVPEPGTSALILAGGVVLFLCARAKRRERI